jgi:hypothetical protein
MDCHVRATAIELETKRALDLALPDARVRGKRCQGVRLEPARRGERGEQSKNGVESGGSLHRGSGGEDSARCHESVVSDAIRDAALAGDTQALLAASDAPAATRQRWLAAHNVAELGARRRGDKREQ